MMGSSFARHAAELLPFCRERGYNDRVALLWDLSRHSGRRRLAVWNFRKGCAEHVFVVSHGSGSTESHVRSARARVSNEDGSAYRLDGLDETNASLRPRCVVLHGWRYTTHLPIWPVATVGSWGCPVVSPRDMETLDSILQREQRVVLWAYMD